MIQSLYIKNFAIISEITIEFGSELNIITGETGAGKSIIINTIDLLLGSRFNKNMIRTNKDKCIIEGIFSSKTGTQIIRRIFTKSGGSKSFINDEPMTLEKLKYNSEFLVDLHGQHDHQRLLNPEFHIEYLDAFGSYNKELLELKNTFKLLMDIKTKYEVIKSDEIEIQRKGELFKFQLRELNAVELYPNIDEEVESEYHKLTSTQDIRDKLTALQEYLDGNNESVIDKLSQHLKGMNSMEGIDKKLDLIIKRINTTQIEMQDFADEISDFNSEMNIDTEHLLIISEKLEHLEMLKRKYGGSMESVLSYKEEISDFLNDSQNHISTIKILEEKLKTLLQEYYQKSRRLTTLRIQTAKLFENKILDTLDQLDLQGTRIDISLTTKSDDIGSGIGQDSCEINIAPNIGEELRPMHKIASGGELSRMMLAIKIAMQDKDPVNTIIFDEVDFGISGKTAEKIGNMIEKLGNSRQIICITHLSQIASKGNNHLKVKKISDRGRTQVAVDQLSPDERILEIAGLISGTRVTKTGKLQAEQLIEGYNG